MVLEYLKLFVTFAKIGMFTIGGGYAMIPLIEREIVNKQWMNKEEFMEMFALTQSLPGVFAVNISIFVGYKLKKVPGDFTASAFVAQTVGVDNVCERAAVAAADGGSLLIHKQAMDGVTIAVAKREKIVLQFV